MIAAHVAGVPVEETILMMIPVLGMLLTAGGAMAARAGRRARRVGRRGLQLD